MKRSENELVARITRAMRPSDVPRLNLGIGDDAALLAPRSGHDTILTCDWFLEGSHFLRDRHPPDSVGWKCLTRALSDIAAMGGTPSSFLLSLAIPEPLTGKWLTQFLAGLRRASRRFACPLAGGDTTRRPEVLINVTVLGDVRFGCSVRRSGAKPGDLIYVSGYLGEADFGLRRLRAAKSRPHQTDYALRKHLYPEPRLELGRFLAARKLATAMIDLSDGLSTDLPRLCSASQVGARIEAANLPLPRVPKSAGRPRVSNSQLFDLALNGGDNYELLFTISPTNARRVPASFRGLPLTYIGEITRPPRLILGHEHGDKPLIPRGWDPFRGNGHAGTKQRG